ncbi:MAG: hypothetical protein E7556_00070 [Ruminococcaceae bacterium]|nr:hypothetical protein [Oscillospiraceae bacterium]
MRKIIVSCLILVALLFILSGCGNSFGDKARQDLENAKANQSAIDRVQSQSDEVGKLLENIN